MPSLEQIISQMISEWRASMRKRLDADSVEELEEHLREAIDVHVRSGKTAEEAFRAATKNLGAGDAIESEFKKIAWADWWAVKVSLLGAAAVIALAAFLLIRFAEKPLGWLLGPHVATVTIGFVATYLAGALGIACVLERSLSNFDGGRVRGAARVATIYSGIAAVLTAIGIALGMLWAKLAWGRYWAWDPKEVGALGLLVWQILFYAAGRSTLLPPRAIMTLAILGNIIVTLSWFAPKNSYSILITLFAIHASFLALAFAPSGCLTRQSEPGSR